MPEFHHFKISKRLLPLLPCTATASRYVDSNGVDAEGPIVNILFLALGCNGITVFLDRRADVQMVFEGTNPERCIVPVTVHM